MSPSLRLLSRSVALAGMTVALLPLRLMGSRRAVGLWFAGCCRIVGISVEISGEPVTGKGVMYVANHVSYLDIPVLGSVIDAKFVAKSEVSGWPVIGWLSRLAGTQFVSRRPTDVRADRNRLAEMLAAGDSMVIFPEGTSSDGSRVLPFRSALMGLADIVQPISIAMTRHRDGRRILAAERDLFAWHGDMELLPHLKGVLAAPGFRVRVAFHPALTATQIDRKRLTELCRERVATGLDELLA